MIGRFAPCARGLVVFLLLLLGGCRKAPAGGRLEASWIGTDTGHFAAPANARWCPAAGLLEVSAVDADEGFGLAIYSAGKLVDGDYAVADTGTDSILRPSASGAYRRFTEQQVVGFRGDSGSVSLTQKGSRVDLTFLFRMPAIDGKDTIEATGTATGLLPGACPADSVPNGPPTQ